MRRAGEDGGAGRELDHLVLVQRADREAVGQAGHPAGAGDELVVLHAEAPALVGLHRAAAERLGEDLVAEADADDRHPGGDAGAEEGLQRLDPGQVVVDAVARAGDEPGVGLAGRGGHLARDHADDGELERRVGGAEQRLEHRRVVAVAGLEVGVDLAGLQDADLHALPPRGRSR